MQPWQPYLDDADARGRLVDAVARALAGGGMPDLPAPVAGLVRSSIDVQDKLRRKFGDGVWIGTARSAMQSTPLPVAELKARWMNDLPVIDVCCGIGGDAIALARRGPVTLIDRDPVMLVAALTNSGAMHCQCRDVQSGGPGDDRGGGVHIDPDRRIDGRRHSRVDGYEPGWEQTSAWAAVHRAALIKIAPAAEIDDHGDRHRAWISHRGSVREQTVLSGTAITAARVAPGGRSAWKVGAKETVRYHVDLSDRCRQRGEPSDAPGAWIVDLDRSVRAAGLTESFAAEYQLKTIGGPAGFLTTDEIRTHPMIGAGRVLWRGSVDDRRLRKTLRENAWRVTVVKIRGGGHDPAVLQKRYGSIGEHPVVLWVGRTARRRYAAVTEPIAVADPVGGVA